MNKLKISVCVFVILIFSNPGLLSASDEIDELKKNDSKRLEKVEQDLADEIKMRNPKEVFFLSISILVFGFLILVIIALLIQKGNDPEVLLRLFGAPLIIISAIFLVVAGYTQEQISPVMGLLGTIAGYLLGKNPESNKKTKAQDKDIGKPSI